ncbi:hypothetical protein CERSUDRAFT_95440 [Gelatoporia subvermispora B]|uniref:Uncharacterized protein n=1 Tax=Ceriporiopsis subvermispora (strain B) TaxID=914234 RepID=M2REB7_CERS8|nr:hypothetical protein CERSUDRAFT_95440 [Gelatoporia subvermispora B]
MDTYESLHADTLWTLVSGLLDVNKRNEIVAFHDKLVEEIATLTESVAAENKRASDYADLAEEHVDECRCFGGTNGTGTRGSCKYMRFYADREQVHLEQRDMHQEALKTFKRLANTFKAVIDRTEECMDSLLDAVHDLESTHEDLTYQIPPYEPTDRGCDAWSSSESGSDGEEGDAKRARSDSPSVYVPGKKKRVPSGGALLWA